MPSWERRPRPREAAPLRAWNGVDAVARVATARDETGENAARARRPNLNPPADGAGIVSCAHCYKRYKTVELQREHAHGVEFHPLVGDVQSCRHAKAHTRTARKIFRPRS